MHQLYSFLGNMLYVYRNISKLVWGIDRSPGGDRRSYFYVLQRNLLSDVFTIYRYQSCMGSANERRRHFVTSSLIGWAHTLNDTWCCQTWFRSLCGTMINMCFTLAIIVNYTWYKIRLDHILNEVVLIAVTHGINYVNTCSLISY